MKRAIRQNLFICLVTLFVLFFSLPANASTYIPLEDDAVYVVLSRLEAEGVINSALLDTKPISRKEAFRLLHEAESNSGCESELIKSLVQLLKDRLGAEPGAEPQIKPIDSIYAKYINTNADIIPLIYKSTTNEKEQAFNYNNNGDLYSRGSNYRFGLTSRVEEFGPLSFSINPEFRSSEGNQAILKTGYAVLGIAGIDLVLGKDSQWWGPGYNSANLISNNAEPFTMIKITSPEPLLLPWILKYLGPFNYTLFSTRLEKERIDFPDPYLNGIRLDFKPLPYLEIGFERIVLLGGKGNPIDAKKWVESFIGVNSHPNRTTADDTDSEAGGDVKLTLPFKLQPVQIYWERDGEDARQYRFGLPYKFEDLYGVFLPRLLGYDRISLRTEYAINHIKGWPSYWYTHSFYTQGMTYHNMIFGNAMGTDSRDAFFELSYYVPENDTRVFLSYDQKTHNLSQPVEEVSKETELKTVFMLSGNIDITTAIGYGRIENPGNLQGAALNVKSVAGEVRYRF